MGIVATAIFDVRNMDKIKNGDTGRVGAAAAQTTNLVSAASQSTFEPAKKVANTLLNYVDDAGKLVGVTNAASKVTGIASKAVNPLLIGASGIRVLKDDDQYAALIEESCAMGTMLASEKLFKYIVANPICGKQTKEAPKWASKFVSRLDDIATKTKGTTKGKLIAIAADLALVGVSILSFDVGKKVGKTLSGRDDEITSDKINTADGLNYKS